MTEDDTCTCEEMGLGDEHECPYASEINDSHEPCQCCPHCTHECAMDI